MAAAGLICVLTGGVLAIAVVICLTLAMLWEYQRMLDRTAPAVTPAFVTLALGAAGALIAVALREYAAGLAVLFAGAAASALLSRRLVWLIAGTFYIAVPMAVLLALRLQEGWSSVRLVLWIFFIVVAADVGAYFAGRRFGGAKLWPRVSPGKTWAGAFGGLVAALAMGVAFGFVIEWRPSTTVAASLVLAVASQLGDLAESAVKRRCGVKDSSTLIPGHGGLLDRMDAVLGAVWALAALILFGLDASTA